MPAIFTGKRVKLLGCIFALLCFGGMLLTHVDAAAQAAERSLALCGRVLLPSLFPFFIVSSLMGEYLPASGLSRLAGWPFHRLFHLPRDCFIVPLMGALGGYPVGARMAARFFLDGRCSENEAVRLLMFCNNAGPAFVINVVGLGLLHDGRTGLLRFAIHLLTSCMIGLIYSWKSKIDKESYFTEKQEDFSFAASLLRAVSEGFSAFLTVCAYVIFFAIVIELLRRCLPLKMGAAAAVLMGCLEMTTGISMLCAMPLPAAVCLPAIAFLLGWGGASVQFQSVQLLRQSGLPCGAYLAGKLIQGCVSALFVFGFLILFR